MRTLHIQLLGDFCLTYGETPVRSFASPRLQSLLAYLVLHRDAPHARQRLAFLFWPDSTETQARTNLRWLLFEFRRALRAAGAFLEFDGPMLRWRSGAPFTLDVDDLQAALTDAQRLAHGDDPARRRALLDRAVTLYRGDLLPACYDDWIAPERERLRAQFIGALESLIEQLQTEGDLDAAIRHAHDLLRHDPVHEATYRRLMRLYALVGDRPGALRTYHACATVLQRELEVEPSPATRKEYEALLNVETPRPAPPATAGHVPLVGRQAEWTRLQSLWSAATQGEAHLVVLEGEAGIGKTRLAEELVHWAGQRGMATASARCYAAEGGLPFAPLTTWLRAHPLPALDDVRLTQVARVLPEILSGRPDLHPAPLTEAWERQHLFESLAQALLRGPQPLLLFIDDLHWCDLETLTFLRYLFRFEPHARLLLLATLRTEETARREGLDAFVLALRQSGQIASLELGPLNEAQTTLLANSVLGRRLDAALARRVYGETEGNPLFVTEMTRLLASGATDLPPRVQAAMDTRLAHLSPGARDLAGVAATIGREFEGDVLMRASDSTEDALVHGLDELWRCHIVREQGARYDFAHGKLRDVIVSQIGRAHSRRLHRRVAEALASVHAGELDAVSAELAAHYDRAGLPELAIPYYERAARTARGVYANELAITHYRRALELSRTSKAGREIYLTEGLADVLHWVARDAEAREYYQKALELASDPVLQARLYRKLSLTWDPQLNLAEETEARDAGARVLEQMTGDRGPDWWYEWIETRLRRMEVFYYVNQWRELEALSEQVRPVIEERGTPAQRVEFLNRLVQIVFRRERYRVTDEAVAHRRTALQIVADLGDARAMPNAHFAYGFALLWHGDLDAAAEQFQTGLSSAARCGDAHTTLLCLTYLGIACRRRGQVPETQKHATQALNMALDAQSPAYIGLARANLGWVAWRNRQWEEAKRGAHAALEAWRSVPMNPLQWAALLPLMALALAGNDSPAGVEYARALLEPPQMRLPDPLETALLNAVDAGSARAARAHLAQAVKIARNLGYL